MSKAKDKKDAKPAKGSKSSNKKKFDDYEKTEIKTETPSGFTKQNNPSATFLKLENVGDEVQGFYRGIKKSDKKNFADSLIIEQDTGNNVLVTQNQNLEDIFGSSKNEIKEGDYILIVFSQVIAVGKTKTFKRFDVFKKDE